MTGDCDFGRDDIVAALRHAVAKVKRLDESTVDESTPLQDYGINSLRALRVCAHMEKQAGISLRPWQLLAGGSLAAIAARTLEESTADTVVAKESSDSAVWLDGSRQLSNAEERMWFLQHLDPESCQYVFTMRLRMEGPLDTQALRAAFGGVLDRHDPLRTLYHVGEEGGLSAAVTEPGDFPLPVIDLSAAEGERLCRRIAELANEERETPFALDRNPLLRAKLLRISETEHVLLCSTHHIAFDGWSVPLLLEELDRNYRRIVDGAIPESQQDPGAPDGVHQASYADFVAAQNAESAHREQRLAWWRERLADAELDVTVPGDLADSGQRTGRAATSRFTLPTELARRVRDFAGQYATSTYVVLLTAFGALAQRYSGAESLLVGTPLTNRTKASFHPLIGMFVNTVVAAYRFDDSPGFGDLVRRTHQSVVEAFDRQDVPFSSLVRELSSSRDVDQTPLFRIMFDLHAFPIEQNHIGLVELSGPRGESLSINAIEVGGADAKFDLTLTVEERGEELLGVIEYRDDRYTSAWARRFAADYRGLLDEFLTRPDEATSAPALPSTVDAISPIRAATADHPTTTRDVSAVGGASDLSGVDSIRSSPEVGAVASVLRGPQTESPRWTVVDQFAENVAERPDSVAIGWGAESLTYGELDRRSEALAQRLRALGAGRGVRVGVLGTRDPWLVVALLAVLRVAAAYIPLDSRHPSARVEAMLSDSAAGLVLVPPNSVYDAAGLAWPELERTGDGFAVLGRDDRPRRAVSGLAGPGDLAYVLFTSGSTGRPKAVEVAHEALANAYLSWRTAYHLDHTGAYLQLASHTFDVFVGDVVRALCSGGRLVLVPDDVVLDPPRLYELMRREAADFLEIVPAVLHELMDHVEAVSGDLAFANTVTAGADVWTAGEHRRLRRLAGPSVHVVNSFGVTEATVDSSLYRGTAARIPDEAATPVGGPLPNTRMYVLDERLRPVPYGVAGELWLAGAGLARGYSGRPDLTAERFVADPFGPAGSRMYRTGDRARILHDDGVVLLGRVDRQFKVRGIRIAPEEVETALATCLGVRRAVVTKGRESADGLTAYLAREPGATVDIDTVRGGVRRILPEAACPARYAVLDTLPLTANGKVDTAALAAIPVSTPATSGDPESLEHPVTEMQRQVAALWSELLGVQRVGVRQNFFELGGHSLLLTRLSAQLWQRFGVRVAVRDLFEHATVAGVAGLVSKGAVSEEPVLERRARRRAKVSVDGPMTDAKEGTR